MKKTIDEWDKIHSALGGIMKKELPIELSLSIAISLIELEKKLTPFFNKRKELYEKYGTKVGDEIIVKDNLEELSKELTKLLVMEISIDVEKIPRKYFQDFKSQGDFVRTILPLIGD